MKTQAFKVTYRLHDEGGRLIEEKSVVVQRYADSLPIKDEFKSKSVNKVKDIYKTSPHFNE